VRAATVRLNFLRDLFGEVFARVVVEGYVRAFAREHVAECRADAARPARYERTLPFEKKAQNCSSPVDRTPARESSFATRA
jgi:hypothetical protein